MTEEQYAAFHRMTAHMLADLGMEAQYDLRLIGTAMGMDEKRLMDEFPELYAEQQEEVVEAEFEEEKENDDEN